MRQGDLQLVGPLIERVLQLQGDSKEEGSELFGGSRASVQAALSLFETGRKRDRGVEAVGVTGQVRASEDSRKEA